MRQAGGAQNQRAFPLSAHSGCRKFLLAPERCFHQRNRQILNYNLSGDCHGTPREVATLGECSARCDFAVRLFLTEKTGGHAETTDPGWLTGNPSRQHFRYRENHPRPGFVRPHTQVPALPSLIRQCCQTPERIRNGESSRTERKQSALRCAHLVFQPGARETPVAFHGALRDFGFGSV